MQNNTCHMPVVILTFSTLGMDSWQPKAWDKLSEKCV